MTKDLMSLDEMLKILELASDVGFKHVKITGGEPLLREKRRGDVIPLIKIISERSYFEDVQLVTNGSLLSRYAKELSNSGLNSITVSLDAATPETFKEITGRDEFCKVLEGIAKVTKYGLPVKINAVIAKDNIDEIPGLIDIAGDFHASLKLIDYMDVGSKKKEWLQNYVPFDGIIQYLERISVSEDVLLPPGGLGTPMPLYTLKDGTKVLVKDSRIGTNYNELCKSCENYPCQDALISLRITANAALKRCLIRNDNLVETLEDLRCGNFESVRAKLKESYDLLMGAKYMKNAWRPPC